MREKELFDLKEEINEKKNEVSQSKGRLQGLMEELKKDWECSSVEQAKKLKEEKKKDREGKQQKIDEGLQELEQNYEL